MEIKHKYFKLTNFGKLLVFLSLFFIVISIPVVVDAYLGNDIYCFSSDDCYNNAMNCPGRSLCRDNRPGYNSYCRKTADDCMSIREKGPISCNNKKITICDYMPIATEAPTVPTCTLSAKPTSITSGDSSTLTWKSTNANKCSASWTSSTATSGTKSVSPSTTTTYNMTCTGATGSASCSAKVTVTTPTHKACNANNICVSVTGAGADTCATNADCVPPTHKACNANNQCVSVAGAGSNTCAINADCAPPTHKECNANNRCISVTGAGDNECINDASCVAATHKECNFNRTGCISVAGGRADQCTDDASCAVAPTDGGIQVKATLDGRVWSGNLNYTLTGRRAITATTVPKSFSASVGSYTLSVTSGGPSNAMLDGISPAASLSVLAGQTTIFTVNFETRIGASHKECNLSDQCVVIIGAGADECTNDVSCGAGASHKECNASKQCIVVAGSGADTCTDDVSCGAGATHKVCNASDQCVSVAGSGPDQCINDSSCTLPPVGFVCNFSWSPESPKAKSAVNFFDYTQTPEGTTLISWDWIFESGTPTTSSDQNPGAVIFNSAGEKIVTLSATNSDNEVCTLSQEITVQSLNPKWIEVLPK